MSKSWMVSIGLVVLASSVHAGSLQYEVAELPYVPLSADASHFVDAKDIDDQGRTLINVEVMATRFVNGEVCRHGECRRVGPKKKSVAWYEFNQAHQYAGNMLGEARWPVRRNSDGTIQKLAESGHANAINNAGVVVGDTGSKAFYFDTELHVLPDLGGDFAMAEDINDDGVIAGTSRTADGRTFAVRYVDGTVTSLGALDGGTYSFARGINSKGTIVGGSYSGTHWDSLPVKFEGGAVTLLGTLGGNYGSAAAINDRGVIVGWCEGADRQMRAFVMDGGVMVDLNTVVSADSQAKWQIYSAIDINRSGQIVANARRSSDQAHVALLLTPKP
jgi:probable HAF family extracellular repeat protein